LLLEFRRLGRLLRPLLLRQLLLLGLRWVIDALKSSQYGPSRTSRASETGYSSEVKQKKKKEKKEKKERNIKGGMRTSMVRK
jgi:hypothetical protein